MVEELVRTAGGCQRSIPERDVAQSNFRPQGVANSDGPTAGIGAATRSGGQDTAMAAVKEIVLDFELLEHFATAVECVSLTNAVEVDGKLGMVKSYLVVLFID